MKKSILILVFTFAFIGSSLAAPYATVEIYSELRHRVLSLTQEDLNVDTPILAVLMETGYEEAVATVVSVADGASSIYFSNGGGLVGAGEHKKVQKSSLALITKASNFIDKLSLTESYPLPRRGYTRFYIVTTSGIYTEEVREETLGSRKHLLSPLFFQGHELLYYIQTVNDD